MKHFKFIITLALLLPVYLNSQTIQIYRKHIGVESTPAASINQITVHAEGGEAYHEIIRSDEQEQLYINDVDSIVCQPANASGKSSSLSIKDYLCQCLENESSGFYVFSKLVAAAGLMDTLANNSYTLFAEPDIYWETTLGKNSSTISAQDVEEYIIQANLYPETPDNNDGESVLIHFVAYHIVSMRLDPYHLVIHANEHGFDASRPGELGIPVSDYYPTMDANRLLKIYESAESNGIFLNRFPVIDNKRYGSGNEVSCLLQNEGARVCVDECIAELNNGYIYPIEELLAYDKNTRNNLGQERIRFDAVTLFPELMVQDVRRKCSTEQNDQFVPISLIEDNDIDIFPKLSECDNSNVSATYCNQYTNEETFYQGDVITISGRFDLILRLPPVTQDGRYQLRMGSIFTEKSGIFQTYWGEINAYHAYGIPVDWRDRHHLIYTYWEDDTQDEEHDAAIDRKIQYIGWYKAPCSINSPGYASARSNSSAIRKLLLQAEMKADKTYYLRLRSVLDGDLLLDYFELVPEIVYSQSDGEDIW